MRTKLAEDFVAVLGGAGHTVEHATFTHSGRDDLTDLLRQHEAAKAELAGEDDGSTAEPEATS